MVNGQTLEKRDGYGLEGMEQVKFEASSDVQLLLMEVPMVF